MPRISTAVPLFLIELAAQRIRDERVLYRPYSGVKFKIIDPAEHPRYYTSAFEWLASTGSLSFEDLGGHEWAVSLTDRYESEIAWARFTEPISDAHRLADELRRDMPENELLLGAADLLDQLGEKCLAELEAATK